MRAPHSLPPGYFEAMFAGTADPWGFETSPYEQAKYDHTVAALAGRHYERGFEIGCARGVLTQRLAAACGTLLAIDVSETALAKAKARCNALPHLRFARMTFPVEAPEDTDFDLIVLSEVAYYWDDRDLAFAGERLLRLLAPGGDLILVHWTEPTDYPQSGDDAVAGIGNTLTGQVDTLLAERRPSYRLDLWRRRPA